MSKIPQHLQKDPTIQYLLDQGLKLLSRGKVRETFRLDANRLLVIASDRISIFEFVLGRTIEKKGEVLTALTHFWLTGILKKFPNHLLRDDIYAVEKELPELPKYRCLVVEDLSPMDEFELIFRLYLGGSVFKDYLKDGIVSGQALPPGIQKWSKLDGPMFTPSTKEKVGHDINVTADTYFDQYGLPGIEFVEMLKRACLIVEKFLEDRGILLLDTKLEGSCALGKIGDEVFTPDSSRFCEKENYLQAMAAGIDPAFMDKEPVRLWGKGIKTPFGVTGINNLDPENAEHRAFVDRLGIPDEIAEMTTRIYLNLFKLVTGLSLDNYQRQFMTRP